MNSNYPSPLMSEDDIRTKVIYPWLLDHGFNDAEILIEHSFEIQLGRQVYKVGGEELGALPRRPRTDILVSRSNGDNLFIIEVKGKDESLDEKVKNQGISYARLLHKIAPFTILTNGLETKIYDSISGEEVSGTNITTDHPYLKNGYMSIGDDIRLRSEALETFISLDSANLLNFCRSQVDYRMRLLRSDDPFSGYKYIPSLYIEREKTEERLEDLLNVRQSKVAIVFGKPQVGKTNFICHTVEKKLQASIPCLFYPAIGMGDGLLQEICEDFGWIMQESDSPKQIIVRLNRILRQVQQKMIVFIDGWNETSQELAESINRDGDRLVDFGIQIVISLTHLSAQRLLLDRAGNITSLARNASLNHDAVQLIEVSPETLSQKSSTLRLEHYQESEVAVAYELYSKVYNVNIPANHQRTNDPLLLRIGMENFSNESLPIILDEPSLMEKTLNAKSKRVIDLESTQVTELIHDLAEMILTNGSSVKQRDLVRHWNIPLSEGIPRGLFEAALFCRSYNSFQDTPCINFYYERERDFVIACRVKGWNSLSAKEFSHYLSIMAADELKDIEMSSLSWFLKQPSYYEYRKKVSEDFDKIQSSDIKLILLRSLRGNNFTFDPEEFSTSPLGNALSDSNMLVRVETIKLIALSGGMEEIVELFEEEDKRVELISSLLEIDEEYPFQSDSIGQAILDALSTIHARSVIICDSDLEGSSYITEALMPFLSSSKQSMRIAAAKSFGNISPRKFLLYLPELLIENQSNDELINDLGAGIVSAIGTLGEEYYGSWCPGSLEGLKDDPEEHVIDFKELMKICIGTLQIYSSTSFEDVLRAFLQSIAPDDIFLTEDDKTSLEINLNNGQLNLFDE